MKTRHAVALSLLAGAALGAAAVQGLHAQAKPPIYYVAEIDVTDLEGWTKDYAPKAQALIKEMGGRVLAAGQNVTSLEGAPPKKRVAIQVWDSMDQIKAWRSSAKFKELQPLRDKYGTARAFTVEGLPN
jgi:uncharacterized protein (DUF1330 family)